IWKLLMKHKTVLLVALKHKLTPYQSKPPHLYGLPKMHKPDITLRPITSLLTEHCINLIQAINLQNKDCLVSSDVVSLFSFTS
ncbi:hypothetical protein B7P43_G11037, partial [Cryptotermes secundus]